MLLEYLYEIVNNTILVEKKSLIIHKIIALRDEREGTKDQHTVNRKRTECNLHKKKPNIFSTEKNPYILQIYNRRTSICVHNRNINMCTLCVEILETVNFIFAENTKEGNFLIYLRNEKSSLGPLRQLSLKGLTLSRSPGKYIFIFLNIKFFPSLRSFI